MTDTPIANQQRAIQIICDEETLSLGLRCQISRHFHGDEASRWGIQAWREDTYLFSIASADLIELRQLLKDNIRREGEAGYG